MHIFWKNIVSFYTTPELPPFLHHKNFNDSHRVLCFRIQFVRIQNLNLEQRETFFSLWNSLLMWKIKQSEHIFMFHSMGVWIQFFFYWLHLRSSASKPVEVIEKYWRGLSEHIIWKQRKRHESQFVILTAVLAWQYETVIFATVDLWILLYMMCI